jgi:hypothetical protein
MPIRKIHAVITGRMNLMDRCEQPLIAVCERVEMAARKPMRGF